MLILSVQQWFTLLTLFKMASVERNHTVYNHEILSKTLSRYLIDTLDHRASILVFSAQEKPVSVIKQSGKFPKYHDKVF